MTKLGKLKISITKKGELVGKLFRVKPVLAWSICTFVVIIASGIHDGLELNISLSIWALICLIIMQSMLSHATNDIVDELVDKDTDIEGTNRFKVLVSGIASRKDLYRLCVSSIIISLAIGIYIYSFRGTIILVLLASGMFMIYAYNFKPLKLNYRPMSEMTVVFPTIMLISFGVGYSAFGTISPTIIYSAVVCAMINILWYMFSRMQDAVPDYKHGKMTTMAYLYSKHKSDPPTNAWLIDGCRYISWMFVLFMIMSSAISVMSLSWTYMISTACCWLFAGIFIGRMYNPKYSSNYISVASYMRRIGMYITYIHCAILSIVLLI
jgi:1,4-dihydroxy-2-naphthoate octaprenyltransferase